jgi:uncharacterized protein (DUF2141 family)
MQMYFTPKGIGWLLPLFVCVLSDVYGQSTPSPSPYTFTFDPVPLIYGNDTLTNAWAGGLNSAQYSTIHLNADDQEDLVVFDRSSDKVTAFIAEKKGNVFRYRHAPYYELLFPQMRNWMLLADYDDDGRKDIFTYTTFGIKVYHNELINGKITWKPVADPINTFGFSSEINLEVSSADMPAIADMDNDGDLDILTSDLATGHRVELHQNQSMEIYGHADSLNFKRIENCWGHMEAVESCAQYKFGITCNASQGGRQVSPYRTLHSGSTLLTLDLNGDGNKDLLMSHISCAKLSTLLNKGTTLQALFTEANMASPDSKPITFSFPAAFYEDLDFDGKKDLIITPNVPDNEAGTLNMRESNWLYKNTGTAQVPVFTYQQADFLQSSMLDVGEHAFPALSDYDGDGDLDLFIGHSGIPGAGRLVASLFLYENTGTTTTPVFTFKTDDYLNLSSLGFSHFKPLFVDMTGDNQSDLVLSSTYYTGNTIASELNYFVNTAPRGQLFQFQLSNKKKIPFNLRRVENPFFFDINKDGKLDILLGKNLGELEYYRNSGTNADPTYVLDNPAFGGLPLSTLDRSQAPLLADLDQNGTPEMIIGDRSGRLKIFADITNDITAAFQPITNIIRDSLSQTYTSAKLGSYIYPTAGDLTGDGLPDLLIGSVSGGISILRNTSNEGGHGPGATGNQQVYPNPARGDYVYLRSTQNSEARIFTTIGQQMSRITLSANRETPVYVGSWPAGMYLIKITSTAGTVSKKLMIAR